MVRAECRPFGPRHVGNDVYRGLTALATKSAGPFGPGVWSIRGIRMTLAARCEVMAG
jgi:hypothetical protein